MTQKFGRQFRLTINPADGGAPIVIQMPFTVEFWIQRNKMASLNTFGINIYNLSEANRRRIFQDRWDYQEVTVNGNNQGWRTILFEAGYGQLYTIFSGQIFQAGSSRQGVDIVTRIQGRTGTYDTSSVKINETFAAGQTQAQLFRYLIGKFPTLKVGYIGNWPGIFQKPVVLNGSVWEIIKTYSNNQAYIDNGNVNILNIGEVKKLATYNINDATGVLETPRRDQGSIFLTTLFEPAVDIDQQLNVESSIQPIYNGPYITNGVAHSGTISGAVCGDLRTVITLLQPQTLSYRQVAQG